ncbi:bifunctional acetaldehyde-CoA/alcohol dehydrogenase [Candidatus Formimonas warabiya]|uniref:bifunctional acetaldehyde-CoA/alcohol dehydrogenase n=1 Tax=Formimonas warabiya TaxID=1761012 RepID=UPI0011D0954C|nr:bifunctional acetaldehyde-CoA/alcohol dehydrogenase [Candidatus Formimonas warabiya]
MSKQEPENGQNMGQNIQGAVDTLVQKALKAREEFLDLNQEQIDEIVRAMALAGLDQHMELAKLAVEETKRGVYEDKITKNIFATEYIYHSIKYHKTVGIIKEDEEAGYLEFAEPVGVITGVTPVTNPTSTTLFKSLISMKTRNPIIFSFHPGAQQSSAAAARIMLKAAVQAGAPENCISWITEPSIEATQALMNHPKVALVLATGGGSMVKSAYSTGKPALGVGPGNVPCYIEKTAHIKRAANDLILSKTFDNGMICASEQGVIVDREIAAPIKEELMANGCYFLSPEEISQLEKLVTDDGTCSLNPSIVGQPASFIAETAGISVPKDTKILIAPLTGVGKDFPLSREKLSPVLAYYEAENLEHAFKLCQDMISFGGMGHTAVIHSENDEVVNRFSKRMMVGRIVVNAPSSHGAIGDIYNIMMPSLTLGCGSMGHNSTTSNVSDINLINIKRVAHRRVNMQWFKVPERIYFEPGSVQYLSKMPGIKKAVIVTDKVMVDLGYVDKVVYHLDRRSEKVDVDIFSDVEPDPSVDTVRRGVEILNRFQPDTIIALGGGSAMDAAKGMWLFYEHPDVEFEFLKLKFLDIRKRTYKYPKLGRKAKMVAIPTTSGSGSEVTAFTVITDKGAEIKYPLADYELTPDVAIIDPEFAYSIPPSLTADTGIDVLTHAIEAYVSIMASDYTDALALKAIDLVFRYLPTAYRNGKDKAAREKMHNASCIAGMAFTNAFLGVTHSLAHKLGGEFHIPHGRANGIFLPHVIAYNARKPSKFVSFPKYEYYIAPEKYRQIAQFLGLPASTPEEGVNSLIDRIRNLMQEINIPFSIGELGINREEYEAKIPMLAEKAFEDQVTITNPRLPLVSELEELFRLAYGEQPSQEDRDDQRNRLINPDLGHMLPREQYEPSQGYIH